MNSNIYTILQHICYYLDQIYYCHESPNDILPHMLEDLTQRLNRFYFLNKD